MLMHLASIEGKWLAIHLCGLVGLSVAGAIAAHVFASVYVACFLVGVTAAAGSFATRALITQDRKAAGLSPALCRELLRATRFSAQSFHHKFDLVLLKIVGAYAARMGQEWKPDDLTPLLRLQFQQIADAHGVAAPNFESD